MTTLFILGKDDNLVDTITEKTGLISAEFHEELNSVVSTPFVFRYSNDIDRTLNGVYVENSVVFRDKDGIMRLFTIKEIDEEHSFEGTETVVTCFPAFTEIKHKLVREFSKEGATVSEVLSEALSGTRWSGYAYGLSDTRNVEIENKSALDVIWDVLERWYADIQASVEFDGSSITERKIVIADTIGFESRVWFEVGRNLQSIRRTILSDPYTTIYPRGTSLDTVEEGSEGKSEYLDIADVEWSTANGDPVDKPLGQKFLTSPQALSKYGIVDGSNTYPREMFWEDSSIDNAETLASAAWKELQRNIDPEVNYEISAVELEENLRLGDTVTVVDHNFNPTVSLRSRIVAVKYDLVDVMGTLSYEVGQILKYKRDNPIKKIVEKVQEKESSWDAPISEESYPNIPAPMPEGVVVKGGFKTIFLSWNFVGDMSVKTYRIHASQTPGFAPSQSNLVYEGSTNAFNHEVDTDQTWYYRIQAVNYKGSGSDYTSEFSASTVKIITDDMLFGSVNADIIADLAVSAEKLADEAVTEYKLGNGAVTETKIANLAVGNAAIQNGAVTNLKIGTAAVDTAQIKDAAITNAKVYDLSADKLTAGTIDANFINVVNLDADSLNVSRLSAISANLGEVTAGTISANTTIDVGTDLSVGNNIQLGRRTDYGTTKRIRFTDATGVQGDGNFLTLYASNGIFLEGNVTINNSAAGLVVNSDAEFNGVLSADGGLVSRNGFTLTSGNIRSVPTYESTSSLASNMHIASSGLIYRATSASKYKDDIQPITRDFNDILSLEPKSWWDKAELSENDGDTTGLWRHHGLIAEDLVNAGLDEMVIWYDGEPEGIQYERLAVYLIPIVKELSQRVEELERVIT